MELFPAYAGVIPMAATIEEDKYTFPRTRGGDPGGTVLSSWENGFSPHTRG